MTNSYQETIDFLEGIMYALTDDGRYSDYYLNPKNKEKLNQLRSSANRLFESMPDFD